MNGPELFGVPLNPLTAEQAVGVINGFVAARTPRQAVFLNAGKFAEMGRTPSLRAAVMAADLRLADGQSVVWACRFLGRPVPERVAGIDLMDRLMRHGALAGWRFFFLGARDEVTVRAVEECRKRFPGITVAGFHHGYFGPGEEAGVAEMVRASSADVLFVAMSSPKKELFVERWLGDMKVPFTMGVGGSFDVVAGITRRAPAWMQRAGLEWLFRLGQEPRRLIGRYLWGNTLFIINTLMCKFRRGGCGGAGAAGEKR